MNMFKRTLVISAFQWFLLLIAMPCTAQLQESGIAPVLPSASAAAYYYISKPGELTMQVNIWGSVHNPGRYEVPSSTDLVQLVSFAGGPTPDAKMSTVRITRVIRQDSTVSREEMEVDLDKLYRLGDRALALHPGDTIYIDRTGWSSFRDYLTAITALAIVTSAIANVVIAEHR